MNARRFSPQLNIAWRIIAVPLFLFGQVAPAVVAAPVQTRTECFSVEIPSGYWQGQGEHTLLTITTPDWIAGLTGVNTEMTVYNNRSVHVNVNLRADTNGSSLTAYNIEDVPDSSTSASGQLNFGDTIVLTLVINPPSRSSSISGGIVTFCVEIEVVDDITATPACTTPGAYTEDLNVNGKYTVDGQGTAGDVKVESFAGTQTASANAEGNFSFDLPGARNHIGTSVTVSSGKANYSFMISEDMFESCNNPPKNGPVLQAEIACLTPGSQTDALRIWGYKQNSDDNIVVKFPDGTQKVFETEDFDVIFANGRQWIGHDIRVRMSEKLVIFKINEAAFASCTLWDQGVVESMFLEVDLTNHGMLEIPSLDVSLEIVDGVIRSGGITQPLEKAAEVNGDYGVHQGYVPQVGEKLHVGNIVLIQGIEYIVTAKAEMSKAETALYSGSHKILVTCNPSWTANVVFTLIRLSVWERGFRHNML